MNNFLQSLSLGLGLGYFIFIWFETHFVVEYFWWLSVVKFKEWEVYSSTDLLAKYPYFLREKYPCWLTRLLGCPFCFIGFVSLWVCLIELFIRGISDFVYYLTVPAVAALSFLVMELLYKNIYLEKK